MNAKLVLISAAFTYLHLSEDHTADNPFRQDRTGSIHGQLYLLSG